MFLLKCKYLREKEEYFIKKFEFINDEILDVYSMKLFDLDIKEKQQFRYIYIIFGKKCMGEEIWGY